MGTPRRHIIIGALVIVIAGSGYVALERWVLNHRLPDGLIQANGRIEGDHVTVASKFPGRIQELLAREGATVTLPGKKALVRSDRAYEVVLIDATETPVERPQKNSVATIRARKTPHAEDPARRRQGDGHDHLPRACRRPPA